MKKQFHDQQARLMALKLTRDLDAWVGACEGDVSGDAFCEGVREILSQACSAVGVSGVGAYAPEGLPQLHVAMRLLAQFPEPRSQELPSIEQGAMPANILYWADRLPGWSAYRSATYPR